MIFPQKPLPKPDMEKHVSPKVVATLKLLGRHRFSLWVKLSFSNQTRTMDTSLGLHREIIITSPLKTMVSYWICSCSGPSHERVCNTVWDDSTTEDTYQNNMKCFKWSRLCMVIFELSCCRLSFQFGMTPNTTAEVAKYITMSFGLISSRLGGRSNKKRDPRFRTLEFLIYSTGYIIFSGLCIIYLCIDYLLNLQICIHI